MELTNTLIFVFLQVHLYGYVKTHYFDDSCVLKSGGIGRCMDIDSCPGAREKLYQFQTLNFCDSFYFHQIVCCENVQLPAVEPWWGWGPYPKCEEDRDQIAPITTTTPPTTPPTTTGEVKFVIGGVNALPLEFPHMAILGYGDPQNVRWRCGGSLVSEKFILTAAHCTQTRDGEVRFVVLGAHQLDDTTRSDVQVFRVNNTYRHPQYTPSARYHDIALLELNRSANIQSRVKPARLHTSREIPNQNLTATGWGATELYGDINNVLQKVNLTYVPYETCERSYRNDRLVPNGLMDDWQLCADGGGKRRDTCQGDSGGPLQIQLPGDQMYTIVGITSLGVRCTLVPAIYTRVSNYVQWIQTTISRN